MTEAKKLLIQGIEEIGLPHADSQISAFVTYLTELKKWNRAYNLTGLKTDREIVIKNFLDSLLFCGVIPDDVRSVADIGSGAGFPGVPIKIMRPDLQVILVEPTQKKVLFLRHLCHRLGLQGIEVMDKRVEEVSGVKVDALVTRALFSVADFMDKAGHMLGENGVLILSKGPKLQEELKGTEGSEVSVRDKVLPYEKTVRHLVLVRRQHSH